MEISDSMASCPHSFEDMGPCAPFEVPCPPNVRYRRRSFSVVEVGSYSQSVASLASVLTRFSCTDQVMQLERSAKVLATTAEPLIAKPLSSSEPFKTLHIAKFRLDMPEQEGESLVKPR